MWVWSGFLGMAKALHCFLLRWLALLSVDHRPVGTNHCFRHTLGQENKTAAQICSGRRRNYTGQGLGLTIWIMILRTWFWHVLTLLPIQWRLVLYMWFYCHIVALMMFGGQIILFGSGGYLKINFGFTETGNARLSWFEDLCVQVACGAEYSELTKTSTALARLAVLSVLSAARRLVLVFVNSL